MDDERKPGSLVRFYHNLMRFSLIGLTSSILLLAFVLAHVVNRLENFMPAEVQLILQLMKNRFFR